MIKFGTGGWRAIIGDDFTKQNIQTLAKALATKMKDEGVTEKGIVMGYDRRFLSKEAMQWAAVVFATEGIKAYLINKSSPTPLVMFYVMKHEFPYGMMITASHNPAIYNGIKVFTAGGRDADEFQTKEIEEYIQAIKEPVEAMEYEEGKEKGLIEEIYPLNEYIDSIMAEINMEAIRSTGLRVALDPMYGVSETSLRIILQTARCEVETIHDRHDTLFGGKLPSPSAATLHQLQNFVVDRGFDIGIATDGDADRIGVIDDTGKFLHPNEILVLLYYYLEKYKEIRYSYDFGDGWEFLFTLEQIVDDYHFGYPTLLDGAESAPPEDVGGLGGFEEFLKIYRDPSHPEYAEMKEWADSQEFREYDPDWINNSLKYLNYKKTEWDQINHDNYFIIEDKYRKN